MGKEKQYHVKIDHNELREKTDANPHHVKGRGTAVNIKNRFEQLEYSGLDESCEYFEEDDDKKPQTTYFHDHTKSLINKVDSPDLGMMYSMNPYRGCEHGCIYCYARPTHEYLGFNAGLDFETKIMVKPDAPKVLAEEFNKSRWKPEVVVMSGNTDCYQPLERKLGITRGCLEVFLKFRNPVAIITKNALVQRDIDLLKQLAELNLVRVIVSITSLRPEITNVMEPRTARPQRRLETVNRLSENGIPVSVNTAPIIPGLTDEELPALLKAASEAGALSAGLTLVRLPWQNKDLFIEWVKREFPDRAEKILNRVSEIHGGRLYNSEYHTRMSGQGKWAETIHNVFDAYKAKYGLNKKSPPLRKDLFRRVKDDDQFTLFR
jgi:DNA repair photolyase